MNQEDRIAKLKVSLHPLGFEEFERVYVQERRAWF